MNIKGMLTLGRIGWRVLRAIVERRRAAKMAKLNDRLHRAVREGGAK
jgi:hypothetical protein